MNYLAHLSLAQLNSHSLTGNLMGDFMKGVKRDSLPVGIQKGITNHRAVDRFTDHHEVVLALKPLFSDRYRRFSGIMVDISFDYFLTKHWQTFHELPIRMFIDQAYTGLLESIEFMPERMASTVTHMAEHDWLSGYADLGQVGYAMDRVAQRIRFRNTFDGAIVEVEQHYPTLEAAFLILYPRLQAHVRELALEAVTIPSAG